MTPIFCLLVIERIVVYVMHNYYIGCGQVDSDPASFGRKQKYKYLIVMIICVDHILSDQEILLLTSNNFF